MKIIIFLIIILLSFSSCKGIETVELNDRMIIESIGIDKKDGLYEITVEGLDSMTSGIENGNFSSAKLTKSYVFEADTIGRAMNEISIRTGLSPLFSQTRVLIIGRRTAEENLSEVLDFFRREYTTRTDILTAVSETTAKEIVSADYGDNISAGKLIEESLSSYKYTSMSVFTPLYKFINSSVNETDSAFCPLLSLSKNSTDGKNQIDIKGTAVFGKNGASTVLDNNETLALMLISGQTERGSIEVKSNDDMLTLEISDSSVRTKTDITDGKANVDIFIKMTCDITEFQTEDFRKITKKDIHSAALSAAEQTCKNISDTVNSVFYRQGFDVFCFGRRINIEDRNFYRENIKPNTDFSQFVSCDISVETSIRRTGKIIVKKDSSK